MRKGSIDWFTLISVILLLCVGVIMVLSASAPMTVVGKSKDAFLIFRKQVTWVGLGLISMYVAANYNYRKLRKLVVPAAVLSLVMLVAVFGFEARNGAHSWIIIGNFQFQPSEFVKICLVLILANIISSKADKMGSFKEGFLPPLIVIGIVCGLVLLERDLGSTIVIALMSFVMLFAGGARYLHLGLLALAGAIAAGLAVLAAPYRLIRITAFLNPLADPLGAGYQVTQSLYAIGSGGLMGVGLGRSLQKYYGIPFQHTDFIFSILAEELGFIGSTFVVILFLFFAARGFLIAKNAKDGFGSLLACGLTSVIIIEAVVNIAVATSSMPVTGITLPFISYGGSSLVFKMTAVGILLNISRYTNREQAAVPRENRSFVRGDY